MAIDRDYQFELDGFTFGWASKVITDGEDGFQPGAAPIRAQDSEFSRGDGIQFGRDYRGAMVWAFNLGTDCETPEQALEVLGDFVGVWQGEKVRNTPGAVMELRYRVGNRVRRVFGRPRRIAYPPTNTILSGWIPITCDFQCADHLTYSDEVEQTTVKLQPAVEGGFGFPLTFPMQTALIAASKEGQIVVGGDAPTWPVITIQGPVDYPRLELLDDETWHVGLGTSLQTGETVVIDTRPWARTAKRSDGSPVGGYLSRQTRLSKASLSPGAHALVFRGIDPTGSARATVAWYEASPSL